MFEDKETCCFIHLIYRSLHDEGFYLLPLNEYDKICFNKMLLGYYDENYIYIIPDVFISRCNYLLNQHGLKAFNVRKILRNLCDLNLLKVYFNLSNGIRYRIQKRVGKTRKRYITFNRGEFEKIFRGSEFVWQIKK